MADVDDLKTRSAAGGALAMLTDFEEVTRSLVDDAEKLPRTVEVVLDMVGDQDMGLKHRGFVVLSNMLQAEGPRGAKVKDVCVKSGAVEGVKGALREVREQGILEVGIEVLKILMGKN